MMWTRTTLTLLGATFLFLTLSGWGIARGAILLEKPLVFMGSTYALAAANGVLAKIGLAGLAVSLIRDLATARRRVAA